MPRCNNIPELPGDGVCTTGECSTSDEAQTKYVLDEGTSCELKMVGTRMDDQPTFLFDCWAEADIDRAGTDLQYYVLDRSQVKTSQESEALYGELHTLPQHLGPFPLRGLVKKPSKSNEATEEGFESDFRGSITIAKITVERLGLKPLKAGDLVQFWDSTFYAYWGQPHRETVPGSGYFFNIQSVELAGYPFDGPDFTKYELTILRDTKYTPERKLYGDVSLDPSEDGF